MAQWAVNCLPRNAIAYDHHTHTIFYSRILRVHWLTMGHLVCSEPRVAYLTLPYLS